MALKTGLEMETPKEPSNWEYQSADKMEPTKAQKTDQKMELQSDSQRAQPMALEKGLLTVPPTVWAMMVRQMVRRMGQSMERELAKTMVDLMATQRAALRGWMKGNS